jgi:hypothetical protein
MNLLEELETQIVCGDGGDGDVAAEKRMEKKSERPDVEHRMTDAPFHGRKCAR